MITRFQISGFKNLVDLDLRFGPFTCIAGENGVGKSNIFDAIQLLSYLADYPVNEAIGLIRGRKGDQVKYGSVADVFRRSAIAAEQRIVISVEMIVPKTGEDDLGQTAEATYNFLKYSLELRLSESKDEDSKNIEIVREELLPLKKGDAAKNILFPHSVKWRNNVIRGKRGVPFISTTNEDKITYINLHQDGGSSGRPRPFLASTLPRTVLSTASYASETPTLLLARREMQSWKFLQLEPSALRQPNELEKFSSKIRVGSDGANLPGTVYRLIKNIHNNEDFDDAEGLYSELANKLSELVEEIVQVRVDKDDKRQTLTLEVVTKDGTTFPARSLSDGTLRFLALSVLDLDDKESGLICLEEPENGIHPDRISAIINLLKNLPYDPSEGEEESAPLRQVIINTHSPSVVTEVPDDSLVYVRSASRMVGHERVKVATIAALFGTWRTIKAGTDRISKGKLASYLNPVRYEKIEDGNNGHSVKVKNRKDLIPQITKTLFDDIY